MNKQERERERERSVIFFFEIQNTKVSFGVLVRTYCSVCAIWSERVWSSWHPRKKIKNKGPEICTEGGGGTGLRGMRVSSL